MDLYTDRSTDILIGNETYSLILTTKATKEIAVRYGGLDKLGDELSSSDDLTKMIDEIIWLITLLANQGILVHNLQNPENKKALLKEDEVELLTSPYHLAEYKDAIALALAKGMKRNILSEPNPKNE